MMDSANKSEPLDLGANRAEVDNDLALAPFQVVQGRAQMLSFAEHHLPQLCGCGCLHGSGIFGFFSW